MRFELAGLPGAPRAVREAYKSWELFKTISAQPVAGMEGISVLPISELRLNQDFLTRLLIKGGTETDIKWLCSVGAMSDSDLPFWNYVVAEYAIAAIDDEDVE